MTNILATIAHHLQEQGYDATIIPTTSNAKIIAPARIKIKLTTTHHLTIALSNTNPTLYSWGPLGNNHHFDLTNPNSLDTLIPFIENSKNIAINEETTAQRHQRIEQERQAHDNKRKENRRNKPWNKMR